MMVIFESQFMYSQQVADDVMKAENVTTSDNVFSKVFVDLFHKQTLQALNFENNVDQTVWYKRWSQWIDWATYKKNNNGKNFGSIYRKLQKIGNLDFRPPLTALCEQPTNAIMTGYQGCEQFGCKYKVDWSFSMKKHHFIISNFCFFFDQWRKYANQRISRPPGCSLWDTPTKWSVLLGWTPDINSNFLLGAVSHSTAPTTGRDLKRMFGTTMILMVWSRDIAVTRDRCPWPWHLQVCQLLICVHVNLPKTRTSRASPRVSAARKWSPHIRSLVLTTRTNPWPWKPLGPAEYC